MGQALQETIEDWAAGVVTNQQTDDIPLNASPRGRNSALLPIAGGRASVMKRRGLATINATPISGTPAIIGQVFYPRSGTNYHLLISDNGRLDKRNTDGTTSAADGSTPSPFTAGSYYPDSALANTLAFICNTQEAKKFNGTSVYRWGVAAPTGTPTLTANAAAGSHSGTYEGFVTYYNANTLAESARSPVSSTVTVVSKKLDWSWSASADAQVTHVRLYLRNTATQPFFYLVSSVAVGATTYTSDVADSSLTVKGPDAVANQLPPTGAKLCEWHYSRMFVSDGVDVYFSEENRPEHFNYNDTLPGINRNDGEAVMLLHSAAGVLIIAKETKTYLLIGDAPSNWRIELLDGSIGCGSHRSVTTVDGITRWWGRRGLIEWDGQGPLLVPGQILLAPTISPLALNYGELAQVVSAEDPAQERILFALPTLGKTRNNIYLPFSTRLRCFESDQWDAIDAASLATVRDSDGASYCYAGGYKGQVFRWWDSDADGVRSATTMAGTVTSATSTTLTVSGATFDTTGGGLAERYVTVIDPARSRIQRRRIASNTSTVLTLASGEDFTDVPTSDWAFVVGGANYAWDSRWNTASLPFIRKRYQFFYMLLATTESNVAIQLSVFFNYTSTATYTESIPLQLSESVGEWDVGEWDTAMFGAASVTHKRVRVAKKGRSWRLRIENFNVNEPLTLHKIGALSELLTDKNPV